MGFQKTNVLKYTFVLNNSTKCLDSSALCYDNKVHIRLKAFDKNQVLRGFENKLTYLLTFLAGFGFEGVQDFNNSEVLKEIAQYFKTYHADLFGENFKGFKITESLSKHHKLGYIKSGWYPEFLEEEQTAHNALAHLMNSLNTNLSDFLFQDAYEIVLTKEPVKKSYNQKFSKKMERKKLKAQNKKVALEVDLW